MVQHREVSLQSLHTAPSQEGALLRDFNLVEARVPEHIRAHIRREDPQEDSFSPGYGTSTSSLEFSGIHVVSSHLFADAANRRVDRSIIWRTQGDMLELRECAIDGNGPRERQQMQQQQVDVGNVLLIRFPGRIVPNVCFVEPEDPSRDPTLYLFVVTHSRTVHRIAISTIIPRKFRLPTGIDATNSLLSQLQIEFGAHHSCEYIETSTRKSELQCVHGIDEGKVVIGLSCGDIIGMELLHRGKLEFEMSHSSIMGRLWSGFVSRTNTDTGVVGLCHLHRGDDTYLLALCSDSRIRVWSLKEKKCITTFDLDVDKDALTAPTFNLDPIQLIQHSVDLYSVVTYLGNGKNASSGQFHGLSVAFNENDSITSCEIRTETIKSAPSVKQNALTAFSIVDGIISALWSTVSSTYCVTRGPILSTADNDMNSGPAWSIVHTRYDDVNSFPMHDYRILNDELEDALLNRMIQPDGFSIKVIREVIQQRGIDMDYNYSDTQQIHDDDTEYLKKHLRDIIDTHVSNITKPLFRPDSHAEEDADVTMRPRATFDAFHKLWQQCLKQWLVNYLPVGIGTITSDNSICLISMVSHSECPTRGIREDFGDDNKRLTQLPMRQLIKTGISIVRPCDPIESLYCPNIHSSYTSASADEDFTRFMLDEINIPKDLQTRRDVMNLVECVRFVADEAGEGLLSAFENNLSTSADPVASAQSIISYLLGTTASRTSSPLQPQRHGFVQQLTKRFRRVSNPRQSVNFLLQVLDFDPYALEMHRQQAFHQQQHQDRSRVPKSVNCKSRTISSLVSNSCIQMIKSRFQFSRDLALLLFLFVQLRTQIGLDIMFRSQLETQFVTKISFILKMYTVLLWVSDQVIRPSQHALRYDISDDMRQMQISSSISQHHIFTPLRREGALIEFLFNEPEFVNRNEEALRELAIADEHSDFLNDKIDICVFLAQQTMQQLWCVYEEQQARAIDIALVLYKTYQMDMVNHFSSLFIQDIAHMHHFLGLYHLHKGEIAEAIKSFTFAAMSISDLDKTKRTTQTELLFSMFEWNPFARAHGQQRATVHDSILFYYYQCLSKYCEKYYHHLNDLILDFARLALNEISGYPLEENLEEVAILWSIAFTYSLKLEQYDMAYVAITSNPDRERYKTDMRRFVNVLVERGELVFLNELPFVGLVADVEDILHQKVRTSDVLQQSPSYHEILYSFYIYRTNYAKAAAVMYDWGQRLGRESHAVDYNDIYLQQQENAYSAALNSLKLMDKQDRWFLLSGVRPGHAPVASPNATLTSTPEIVTDQQIAEKLLFVQARLELSRAWKAHHPQQRESDHITKPFISPDITPADAVALLMEAQLYDKALAICELFCLEKMSVFESMAARFANLKRVSDVRSADKCWRMINMALQRFGGDSTGTKYAQGQKQKAVDTYHVAVMRTILETDRNAKVRELELFKDLTHRNPSALLHILLQHDRISNSVELVKTVLQSPEVADRREKAFISLLHLENVLARLAKDTTGNYAEDLREIRELLNE